MKKQMHLSIDIEIVDDFGDEYLTVGCIYYPDEGNKIQILKGQNIIEFTNTLFHEIGHLVDWYISDGKQNNDSKIREQIADDISSKLIEKYIEQLRYNNN